MIFDGHRADGFVHARADPYANADSYRNAHSDFYGNSNGLENSSQFRERQ